VEKVTPSRWERKRVSSRGGYTLIKKGRVLRQLNMESPCQMEKDSEFLNVEEMGRGNREKRVCSESILWKYFGEGRTKAREKKEEKNLVVRAFHLDPEDSSRGPERLSEGEFPATTKTKLRTGRRGYLPRRKGAKLKGEGMGGKSIIKHICFEPANSTEKGQQVDAVVLRGEQGGMRLKDFPRNSLGGAERRAVKEKRVTEVLDRQKREKVLPLSEKKKILLSEKTPS